MKKLGFAICLLLLFSVRTFAQDVTASAKQTKSTIVVQVNGLNCSTAMGQGTFNAVEWSFGATDTVSSGAGGGAGAGKAMVGTLNLQKHWDECSPELFVGTVTGKTFKTVTLTQSDANENVVLTVQLTNAILTSFQISGEQSKQKPLESLSFDFQKICIKDASAGTQACFNKNTNTTQ